MHSRQHSLIAAALLSLGLVAACSSSTEGDACQIVGTYTTSERLRSGDCPVDETAHGTVTISKAPAGSGCDYIIELSGLGGKCCATSVNACKIQSKCDIAVTDATTPGQQGTAQYSWTFRADGYGGTSSIVIPPATSLPKGCSGTADITGERR